MRADDSADFIFISIAMLMLLMLMPITLILRCRWLFSMMPRLLRRHALRHAYWCHDAMLLRHCCQRCWLLLLRRRAAAHDIDDIERRYLLRRHYTLMPPFVAIRHWAMLLIDAMSDYAAPLRCRHYAATWCHDAIAYAIDIIIDYHWDADAITLDAAAAIIIIIAAPLRLFMPLWWCCLWCHIISLLMPHYYWCHYWCWWCRRCWCAIIIA